MSKKSFVIYDSWATLIASIPTEQAGELIQAICKKRIGESVEITDPSVAGMFAMIAPQLDADSKKYQEKCDRIKAAREKIETKNSESESELKNDESDLKREKSELKNDESGGVSVSDSVSDSVSVHPTGVNKRARESKQEKQRHKFGQYSHVILSDDEFNTLAAEHGEPQTHEAIRAVDEYCEQSGKRYKNYALVLKKWGFKAVEENARSGTTNQGSKQKGNKFNNFRQRDYDFDVLERRILNSQIPPEPEGTG